MNATLSMGRTLLGLVLIAGTLALAACGTSSGATSSSTPTSTAAVTPTTSSLTGYPIKVYFSNNPGSMTAVSSVNRVSPTSQVEEFSIQLLIAGPTPEERVAGLFSELNDAFTGSSYCTGTHPVDGPDFILTLNMKGTTPEPGTATLKFCRATSLPGEGTGARIKAEINATLLQFSTVKKVVILSANGNCFDDLNGQNLCLK